MTTGDLKALQELLGLSTLRMTLRYTHFVKGHKANAIKDFEKRMSEKSGYFMGSLANNEKHKIS